MSQTTAETFYQDLNSMSYLEQIMQETLRMYPVAVATTRTNYVDTVLGKSVVPAGSTVMVSSDVSSHVSTRFKICCLSCVCVFTACSRERKCVRMFVYTSVRVNVIFVSI